MTIQEWALNELGYEMKTTFWEDFSIADAFGRKAVEDTYKRVLRDWKNNITFMTELVLILAWKFDYWYSRSESISCTYEALWEKAQTYVEAHFKDEDLKYYFMTID